MENKPIKPLKSGKLFIVSAPSGTGKTTLVTTVIQRMQEQQLALERVITYTTKNPRVGEQGGIDYHFISSLEFEKKIDEGFFIEWSSAYGHYYGSPRHVLQEIEKARSFILIIDRIGAQKVIEQKIPAISIWIEPPSLQTLRDRLVGRAADSATDIEKRLKLAAQEMAQEQSTPLYMHRVINDVFEAAVTDIERIVMQEILQ